MEGQNTRAEGSVANCLQRVWTSLDLTERSDVLHSRLLGTEKKKRKKVESVYESSDSSDWPITPVFVARSD